MLRTIGNRISLAGVLIATACFCVHVPHAAAQELVVEQDGSAVEACPDGQTMGTGGAVAGRCRLCGGLHNQTVNCRPQYYGQPELFYNYYIPGTCGGVPAAMYLAPQPVPPLVGHTYYTYQPFMPHELLYQHHRTYYRYYDGGRGMTRARVSWYRPPFTGWSTSLRIAR
jgi:hypothetical protein